MLTDLYLEYLDTYYTSTVLVLNERTLHFFIF